MASTRLVRLNIGTRVHEGYVTVDSEAYRITMTFAKEDSDIARMVEAMCQELARMIWPGGVSDLREEVEELTAALHVYSPWRVDRLLEIVRKMLGERPNPDGCGHSQLHPNECWSCAMTTISQLERYSERQVEALKALEETRKVLERARHNLTTLSGLDATDGFMVVSTAQHNRCDSNGAWDSFVAQTWKIDESKIIAEIDAILEGRG